MAPRRFTLEEAEGLLPRLTELLLELQARKEEYDRFGRQVVELNQKMRGNGHVVEAELKEAQAGLERTNEALNALAGQVNEMGCELKDVDRGLIDFRTEMDSRDVYLCWALGEARIDWWHDLETGFAGRQPLAREADDR
jgi:hypothetical protein